LSEALAFASGCGWRPFKMSRASARPIRRARSYQVTARSPHGAGIQVL
jgi:hypothetical protein